MVSEHVVGGTLGYVVTTPMVIRPTFDFDPLLLLAAPPPPAPPLPVSLPLPFPLSRHGHFGASLPHAWHDRPDAGHFVPLG